MPKPTPPTNTRLPSEDDLFRGLVKAQIHTSLTLHKRFALIGCSSTKTDEPGSHTPDKLYTSALFQKRLQYVTLRGIAWSVISANFGLLLPWDRRPTYNLRMQDLDATDRSLLVCHVLFQFATAVKNIAHDIPPKEITIEFHAGKEYGAQLCPILTTLGYKVEYPFEGLGIGEQLGWYTRKISELTEDQIDKKVLSVE